MYTHILIATDGSELAQKGIDHGLSLARQLSAKVTMVTVSEPIPVVALGGEFGLAGPPIDFEALKQSSREAAEKILGSAREAAERIGVAVETIHVEDKQPAEAIVDTAGEKGCNLIVMASHGHRGLRRILLGSQTVETLTHSPIPVLVVR